jgi:hypothetical protein
VSIATIVSTNSAIAAKRVPMPNSNAAAASSSIHVASVQLTLALSSENGSGNLSAMSANQLSPCSFSRPASKNSHARITRRPNGATQWPAPSRRRATAACTLLRVERDMGVGSW